MEETIFSSLMKPGCTTTDFTSLVLQTSISTAEMPLFFRYKRDSIEFGGCNFEVVLCEIIFKFFPKCFKVNNQFMQSVRHTAYGKEFAKAVVINGKAVEINHSMVTSGRGWIM